MNRASSRLIEYAMAIGVPIPSEIDDEELYRRIQAAKSEQYGPPHPEQLRIAQELCINVSGFSTRRDIKNFLFTYLDARRWVYSVVRHIAGAKWREYSESGLSESTVARIALALIDQPGAMADVQERSDSNSLGGDNWTRIAGNAISSPAYQFVKNFDIPDEELAAIRVPATARRSSATGRRATPIRKRKPAGCMGVILVIAIILAIAWTTAATMP